MDIQAYIAATFEVKYHETTVGKLLRRLGLRHVSVRPAHPQGDAEARAAFKKLGSHVEAVLPDYARGKPLEIWVQDEARVGQKGTLTYIWAETGTRPTALRDQRYACAYIFGAVCPARGTGAALILPYANTAAMKAHLKEISTQIETGSHAVVIIDGAGWHTTKSLKILKISACCACRRIVWS